MARSLPACLRHHVAARRSDDRTRTIFQALEEWSHDAHGVGGGFLAHNPITGTVTC
jgi:hypothetical protein